MADGNRAGAEPGRSTDQAFASEPSQIAAAESAAMAIFFLLKLHSQHHTPHTAHISPKQKHIDDDDDQLQWIGSKRIDRARLALSFLSPSIEGLFWPSRVDTGDRSRQLWMLPFWFFTVPPMRPNFRFEDPATLQTAHGKLRGHEQDYCVSVVFSHAIDCQRLDKFTGKDVGDWLDNQESLENNKDEAATPRIY